MSLLLAFQCSLLGRQPLGELLIVSLQLIEGTDQRGISCLALSSITASGRLLTNTATSDRRVFCPLITTNRLTASQSLFSGCSKSISAGGQRAVLGVVLDIHAFRQRLTEAAVFFKQDGSFGLRDLADRIMPRLRPHPGVQARHGALEALAEDDFIVAFALRPVAVGADLVLAFEAEAKSAKLIQQRAFNGGPRKTPLRSSYSCTGKKSNRLDDPSAIILSTVSISSRVSRRTGCRISRNKERPKVQVMPAAPPRLE